MWDVPSEATLPSFSFSTLMRHERSDQMEALARTLAQHGSTWLRYCIAKAISCCYMLLYVAICCYQIMSYMIYIYMCVCVCHIKSICFFVFFRALELHGTPWSRSHDGWVCWVGVWSTMSCLGLWMTPVLAAIECNPALGAVWSSGALLVSSHHFWSKHVKT